MLIFFLVLPLLLHLVASSLNLKITVSIDFVATNFDNLSNSVFAANDFHA